MEPKTEKMALFIDGANLYATAKSLGFDIDYKRLLSEFHSRGYLLRAFYYTAVAEDQEYSSIRPLIDWLDYNGYSVVTKATKDSSIKPAGARSKATWTSSSRSMPWKSQVRSTTWCCSRATATSARWSRRCSGAACACPWSPPSRRSRRWLPPSCAGKPTSSSTSSSCSRRSAAIRPSAARAKRASRATTTCHNSCSGVQPRKAAVATKERLTGKVAEAH